MKFFYLQFFIISLLAVPSIAFNEKGTDHSRLVDKAFKQDFLYQNSESFFKFITKYNRNKANINNLLEDMNSEDQKFMKSYLSKNNIITLPEIKFKKGVAIISKGSSRVSFTVESLLEHHVYINGKKVKLPNDSAKNNLNYFIKETSNKKITLLDLFISDAVAEDKFESALFAALLLMSNDKEIESMSLFSSDETTTKNNFKIIMNKMKIRAQKCQTGEDEQEVFASRIDDFVQYQSATVELEKKIEVFYEDYKDKALTCEDIVGYLYKEQISEQMEKAGFYSMSISIAETREANQKKYDQFIASECGPYNALKTCLVNKNYQGREVYNNLSGKEPLRYNQKLKDSNYKPTKSYKDVITK